MEPILVTFGNTQFSRSQVSHFVNFLTEIILNTCELEKFEVCNPFQAEANNPIQNASP